MTNWWPADLDGRCLVGFDLIEVGRFERALTRHPRLLERVFTQAEIAYCRSCARPVQHLAARFCAKEAVGKLLGRGVTAWREIEIIRPCAGAKSAAVAERERTAQPQVVLHGEALKEARKIGIKHIAVSLSHSDSLAGACAVAFAEGVSAKRTEGR